MSTALKPSKSPSGVLTVHGLRRLPGTGSPRHCAGEPVRFMAVRLSRAHSLKRKS
jgi:hypothetical protein